MKRAVHLGLTILCLLALVVLPVFSGATLHAAKRGCRESMSDRMPMPPTHTAPPCCTIHSPDGIAPAAIDVSLALPPLVALSLEPLFAPAPTSAAPRQGPPYASPPRAFPLPLRI